MRALRCVVLCANIVLVGCGIRIPEIQENPFSPGDGILMVQAIVQSVHCEVVNALKDVVESDRRVSKQYHQKRVTDFLQKWGTQVALTLTIDEKSAVSPNVVWSPPSPAAALFSLGAGGTVSSEATRIDKMSFYYTVPSLLAEDRCTTGVQQGNENSPLVTSDLKLKEWLASYLSAIGTRQGVAPVLADGALKTEVLSHDIKFDIVSTGNITPSWKLTRVDVNQDGSLFSASRERTHDLIITLGPGDKTGFTTDAPLAASQALQIGNAVTTGFRSVLGR